MIDLTYFTQWTVSFAATYLLHSTVLISACWLVIKGTGTTSHVLAERMWKSAAVMGLVTAVLQTCAGASSTLEVTWFAPQGSLSERPLEELPTVFPAEPVYVVPGAIPVSPPSTELLGAVPEPPLQRDDALAPQVDDPITPYIDKTNQAETADVFTEEHDLPAAPAEAKHEIPIDQVAASRSRERLAPIVVRSHWFCDMLPSAPRAISVLLAICIAAGALRLAWQSFSLQRRFWAARVLRDGHAKRTLDRFLRRNGIRRRVRLLSSRRYAEPITYGLFCWTIVLPEGTDQRLGQEELEALFAHEVAHLVRGDVRWLWIGRLLCTCLAFQPLNFAARRRWQQAAEYLCDDWAVRRGIRSLALARCLTQIAEWRFGRQPCRSALAAGGSRATLVQRVERLVDGCRPSDVWTRPRRRRLLNSATLLCIPLLVGIAPRVGVPLAIALGEHTPSEIQDSADFIPNARPLRQRRWETLQEELRKLEVDLNRAAQLMADSPHDLDAESVMNDVRRRAASLRARRERITRHLKGS